jgi:Ala-tRNA(Pro) deacylase
MSPLQAFKSYLDQRRIPYETMHHRRDYTAQRTAADTHTRGKHFAKSVILAVDNTFGMFVLPAIHKVDMEKVKQALIANEVRLATESEISGLCPECEVGAMPAFGMFYKLPTYVSHYLPENNLITFNAGTHVDAVTMLYQDYQKLVRPKVMNFTADKK